MKRLSELRVLVKDSGGLGIEHAVAMGKACKEVIYFNTWQDGFCQSKKKFLGMGFENIKKNLYFDDKKSYKGEDGKEHKVDLIMYPDIGHGDNANALRKEGYIVFGSGDAEKFENHRYPFRKLQESLGLPTQETHQVIGIDKLEIFLEKNKDKKWVIKVDNEYRGDCETFPAPNLKEVKSHLDNLRVKFGPFSDIIPFCVEEQVEAKIEIGIDGLFSVPGLYRPSLWGFEAGRCYLGKYSEVLPPTLEDCISRLAPALHKRNYRGAISTENLCLSVNKSVLIDMTCRFPYNLSVGYPSWLKNYAKAIYAVALGEKIALEPVAEYVGGAPLYVDTDEEWVKWKFPKSLREEGRIKFRECAKKDGDYYAIRGCNSAAFIVAWGKSPEQVVSRIKETCKLVSAHEMDDSKVTNLDGILRQIKDANIMGLKF